MGNYRDLEPEFIERTMELVSQYHETMDQYPFEKQFNHTLTINCLLGLIVMPKEKIVTYIPNHRLTAGLRKQIGIEESEFYEGIKTLRDMIQKLRHSVAHFDIRVISEDEKFHVDWIEFMDTQNGDIVIARIKANELLPFLKYYSGVLMENLRKYRNNEIP